LFILVAHNDRRGRNSMGNPVEPREGQAGGASVRHPERRRSNRAALSLAATMREGTRGKVKVRLIDISTHGCRIECNSTVGANARVWLNIAGLEAQNCRVVWHCQEFIGLEFESPLADAVLEKLLQAQQQLPESRISELREIATRTHWLARQAGDSEIHPLAELSRTCAVDAVVEGMRLAEAARAADRKTEPPAPPAAG
jgi:hypothetical protein